MKIAWLVSSIITNTQLCSDKLFMFNCQKTDDSQLKNEISGVSENYNGTADFPHRTLFTEISV